jgi:hypothetical protein
MSSCHKTCAKSTRVFVVVGCENVKGFRNTNINSAVSHISSHRWLLLEHCDSLLQIVNGGLRVLVVQSAGGKFGVLLGLQVVLQFQGWR